MNISKKLVIHWLLSGVCSLFTKKKHLVFYAPVPFHAAHLKPVITAALALDAYEISLVGDFKQFKEFDDLDKYDSLADLPIHKRYRLFITTEVTLPWGLLGKKVFFGHGIGPKLTYQSHELLKQFDALFAPCLPIFDAQTTLNVQLEKIGLPLLDNAVLSDGRHNLISRHFNTSSNKPTILYAPSWSKDNTLISDVIGIMKALSMVSDFNVIVSPHPNLFNPDKYIYHDAVKQQYINTNDPESGISTFELAIFSDIVLSDISSILFEALAMHKKVLFDGNERIYEECGAIPVLTELKQSILTLALDTDLNTQLNKIAVNYDVEKSNKFISNYLFNNGNATSVFIKTIDRLIHQH